MKKCLCMTCKHTPINTLLTDGVFQHPKMAQVINELPVLQLQLCINTCISYIHNIQYIHSLPLGVFSVDMLSYHITGNPVTDPSQSTTTDHNIPPFGDKLPHYPNPAPSSTVAQPDMAVFTVNQPQSSTAPNVAPAGDMSLMIILAVFGGAILLLVVAISIVTIMILVHKYRVKRQKSWAILTEQQKVDRMKESGYINPTYQFFDQVSQ